MSHPSKTYNKTARTPNDLLTHLQTRGLSVPDRNSAQNALKRIGYYRLLIYMRPLQDPTTKHFRPGTTFDEILQRYNFDRELRLLCLDAIERIEVALRAAIINELAVAHGAHFHLNSRHFEKIEGFRGFIDRATKAQYLGISHYYDNYNEPSIPPIWTILEGVTLGTLSRMYSNLHPANRRLIAVQFNFPEQTIVSWLRSINDLRNMCAHHNRLFNAVMQVNQPMQNKRLKGEWSTSQNRLYARALVLIALLKEIDPSLTWKNDLKNLLARYPQINPTELGFPTGWNTRPFWL